MFAALAVLKTTFVVWFLTAMQTWAPIPAKKFTGEDVDAARARYAEIARDVLDVTFDPDETPLAVFATETDRAARFHSAGFLLSIARFESNYALSIETGKVRGQLGEVCILQVLVSGKTAEGWSAKDLIADRQKCIRAAYHILRLSETACGDAKSPHNASHIALGGSDLYGIYTSGKCYKGNAHARHRLKGWIDYAVAHDLPNQFPNPQPMNGF